ncbi:MAG: hypothetical protein CBD31_01685 [Flavobacteriaceae bacterium TMED171]|nr:MAG: hypothetical protein CBD31_01685 [Flavobacteriaceae bacterium TMED171]|tara:strand:+ start:1237 stop:1455 length:219 start_codon:yes stop_codon:yes gene_type:complete
MYYKIFPKVRVWLSDAEQELLDTIENSPDEQVTKNSLGQELLPTLNLLLSKSVIWRKKTDDDVIYGKRKIYR